MCCQKAYPSQSNRKQARFYISISVHLSLRTRVRLRVCSARKDCVLTECQSVSRYIYICERVYLCAHTRCTRTRTLAHTLAPTHTHAHIDTAHVRAHACVCAHARVHACALQRDAYCAHTHARTQTLRTNAAPRRLRVSASTRVCERVSARANARVWSISGR